MLRGLKGPSSNASWYKQHVWSRSVDRRQTVLELLHYGDDGSGGADRWSPVANNLHSQITFARCTTVCAMGGVEKTSTRPGKTATPTRSTSSHSLSWQDSTSSTKPGCNVLVSLGTNERKSVFASTLARRSMHENSNAALSTPRVPSRSSALSGRSAASNGMFFSKINHIISGGRKSTMMENVWRRQSAAVATSSKKNTDTPEGQRDKRRVTVLRGKQKYQSWALENGEKTYE